MRRIPGSAIRAVTRWAGRLRIAVASVGLLTLVACGAGSSSGQESTPRRSADVRPAGTNRVVMHLIAYQPERLKVAVGTTVDWVQQDAGFHTVTSGTAEVEPSGNIVTHADGKFRSAQLAQGQRFSFTFTKPGTYPYFCEIHPATMRGEITVS